MLNAILNFSVSLVFTVVPAVGAIGIGVYAIFATLEIRGTAWPARDAGLKYPIGG